MAAYGAEFDLTPREMGMKGAMERAKEMADEPGRPNPQQFENQANVEVHRQTTAREILEDFPDGLDVLITGVGTGGHITGVGEVLKKRFHDLKAYAVEPVLSPVLSGGAPSPHPIQGIGAGFIPDVMQPELRLTDGPEETVWTIPASDASDVQHAITAARSAQPEWAAFAPSERGRLLGSRRLVRQHQGDQAYTETVEKANRMGEADEDIAAAADTFEYDAGMATKIVWMSMPLPGEQFIEPAGGGTLAVGNLDWGAAGDGEEKVAI